MAGTLEHPDDDHQDPVQDENSFLAISPEAVPEPPLLKHSGLGLASFILSVAMTVLIAVCFTALILAMRPYTGHGIIPGSPNVSPPVLTIIMLFGLGLIVSGIGYIVGIILGIVGLVQKNRKKVFAVLGTVFNGLAVLLFVILMIVGVWIAAMRQG